MILFRLSSFFVNTSVSIVQKFFFRVLDFILLNVAPQRQSDGLYWLKTICYNLFYGLLSTKLRIIFNHNTPYSNEKTS